MPVVERFDGKTRTLGFLVFGMPDGLWYVTDCGAPLPNIPPFERPIDALEQANAMQRRRWYDAARN